MKNRFQLFSICLLSMTVALAGTSRDAEAHTVNLAYRCEDDGSVTFFAATDHLDAAENSGGVLLSTETKSNLYYFDDWEDNLPDDVDDQWGWQGDADEDHAVWQAVNVPYFRSGSYIISTSDNLEEHVALPSGVWEVEIDCDTHVIPVEIDIEPRHVPESPNGNGKGKAKGKGKNPGKAKGNEKLKNQWKAKGKAMIRGRGKAISKEMSQGRGNAIGKELFRGRGKAMGKELFRGRGKAIGKEMSRGNGKAKGKGKSKHKGNARARGYENHYGGDSPSADDVLSVAILSDSDFDATLVVEETVELGNVDLDGVGYPLPLPASVEDVNGDGFDDLILYFSRSEMVLEGAIDEETLELQLTGFTSDGHYFFGFDQLDASPSYE